MSSQTTFSCINGVRTLSLEKEIETASQVVVVGKAEAQAESEPYP